MSDEGSRADRLRRRREQQRDQQADRSRGTDTGNSSEPSERDETDEPDETSPEDERTSVKDDRVGTYMYLPEDQRAELDFAYKELSLVYERAFGEELEKNRHFYPMLVEAGLERLDGLDGDDLRDRLKQLEE
ncbi:hypothetical protein [Halomicrococcus sp. SG-WS-1]|uniref:hypothetical protein n=1 Tax=Halomicrococcus sp. SG-WS-1 TaxID=3439057 RepID=UPI003F7900C7